MSSPGFNGFDCLLSGKQVSSQKSHHRINSKAAFFILKAAATHVSDEGKIISIVTALLGAFTGFYTSYAGSKAPVEHFTRGVCKELQARRVSVNNVAPGPMDTRKWFLLQRQPTRWLIIDIHQMQPSSIHKKSPRQWHSTKPMVWGIG